MEQMVVGLVLGAIITLITTIVNSWIAKTREREHKTWQVEISRIIELEERAGQLVSIVTSYNPQEWVEQHSRDDLQWLLLAAGRFRRHPGISQVIKDLRNDLMCVLEDRREGDDSRTSKKEVISNYDKLLKECDKVTGKRII